MPFFLEIIEYGSQRISGVPFLDLFQDFPRHFFVFQAEGKKECFQRPRMGPINAGGGMEFSPVEEADLFQAYPKLTHEDIQSAIRYAADTLAHEEIVILSQSSY
jgi:hypothetical protein